MKEEQIIDYLLGQLTDKERIVFESALATDPMLCQEVEEMKLTWKAMQDADHEPDEIMDSDFYALLEQEKRKLNHGLEKPKSVQVAFFNTYFFKAAAAIVGIGLAFWMGRFTAPERIREIVIREPQKQEEIQPNILKINTQNAYNEPTVFNDKAIAKQVIGLQKEMKLTQELLVLSLLKNSSASDRIQGINLVATMPKIDDKLLQELISVLRKDESLNVRLSAIELLSKFNKETKITGPMVAQLSETTEPMEQINLMEALVRMRAKESLLVISKIEQNKDFEPNVRSLAKNSINQLLYENNNQTTE
jgi:hypothetical protein